MSPELLEKKTELLEKRVEKLEAHFRALDSKFETKLKRHFGVSVEEIKASITNPLQLTEEEIQQAKKIVGTWEGPEDLSENFRDYLRGDKKWPQSS